MQQNKKRKGSKNKIILIMLIAVVLGASAGVLYIDTAFGEGKARAWIMKLTDGLSADAQSAQNNVTPIEPAGVADVPTEESEEEVTNMGDIITLGSDGQTYFASFDKRILMCTKDGVQFLNSIGDQKWNDTYTMASPCLIKEGNFAAVGDMSGRSVYVYNDVGKQYSVQTEGALTWFSLNANGYLSLISNNNTHYEVAVYNQTGQKLTRRVEESQGVYPLSVDISDDNTVFAISYLDISDVNPISKVVFFYVGNSGKEVEFTDSMFAAKELESQAVPFVGFMNGGILVAVSDQKITGLGLDGNMVWEVPLTNRIERVDLGNKEHILVSLGDSLSGQDGVESGSVYWINSAGKLKATFLAGGKVDYLKSSQELTVVGSQNHFYGIKPNGKILWEHSAKTDISDILMMGSNTKALYVSKQSAEVVDMLEKSSKENKETKKSEENTKENTQVVDNTNDGTSQTLEESGT